MNSPGSRIGLTAVLLLVVTSALVWDRVWRDATAPPRTVPPRGESILRLSLGGIHPSSRLGARPGPRGRTPSGRRKPAPLKKRPAPVPPKTRTWRVERGDCLNDIARKVYGSSGRWPEIAAANGLSEPFLIRPGEVLRIP